MSIKIKILKLFYLNLLIFGEMVIQENIFDNEFIEGLEKKWGFFIEESSCELDFRDSLEL